MPRNNNPLRAIPDFVWALIAIAVLSVGLVALAFAPELFQP